MLHESVKVMLPIEQKTLRGVRILFYPQKMWKVV